MILHDFDDVPQLSCDFAASHAFFSSYGPVQHLPFLQTMGFFPSSQTGSRLTLWNDDLLDSVALNAFINPGTVRVTTKTQRITKVKNGVQWQEARTAT